MQAVALTMVGVVEVVVDDDDDDDVLLLLLFLLVVVIVVVLVGRGRRQKCVVDWKERDSVFLRAKKS